MMSVKTEPCEGGVRIVKASTLDSVLEIPGSVCGAPVVAIGPAFMEGGHSSQGRTVKIPETVKSIDSEAFDMATGLTAIEYGGDIRTFSSFGLTAPSECTLRCRDGGRPFSFSFPARMPMSFPAFDDAAMSSLLSIPEESAMTRLKDPVMLSEKARAWYVRKLTGIVLPRAEQAVSSGNGRLLEELFSTGMLDGESLRKLLERSARSGRVPMTSLIMSLIRRI